MNITKASSGFAAVGAEPRLQVLLALVRIGSKGLSVGEIQKTIHIPASTLAHHLRSLVDSGLIRQVKVGRQVSNIANFKEIHALGSFLMNECCVDSDTGETCP